MEDLQFRNQVYSKADKLYRIALRILGNTEDAEDALSFVMTKAWESRKSLSKYESIEAVLVQTIKNHAIDQLRKSKRLREFHSEETSIAKNPGVFKHKSKHEIVQEIINQLPEKQRIIIHLRMVEGYSMQQIAEIMDEKVNTIEANVSRARKKIREGYEKRYQRN
ncbi:MAG: sigma-70 family RNA polymerase sigma factor [bacterium]|nr:sigma-70 family RNA polymerase sigma factor [bacterium]